MQNSQNINTPLISFIVTYHNEPIQLLKECLDSIFELSLSNEEREIILVDDGSDESPLNEIVEYRDKINYLRQPHMGVCTGRNNGITLSSGTYLQFIDADDCLITNSYEHCLDIVRYKNPDMVLFNFTTEGTDVDTPYLFNGPLSGTEYMRHNNLKASVCSYIFRKKTLVDLRFTSGLEYGEDEEFTPQLILRAENIYVTETCAYYYRDRIESVSHQTSSRAQVKQFSDAEHVILYLDHLANTLPIDDRTALQRRVAQLTMDYIYNVIVKTHSEHQLNKRLEKLRGHGLFPLPDCDYTQKYKYFRKMINHKFGRKILLNTLPYISNK